MKRLAHKKSISFLFYLFFWVSLGVVLILGSRSLVRGQSTQSLFKADVAEVIDGDTIRLKDGRLVRYIGIDAPEMRRKAGNLWVYDPEPFAEEATKLNRKLVEGKEVLIEVDPVGRNDKFDRLLAHVYVDKVLVNEELLRAGLAKTFIPSLLMKHRIRFWSIEEMAWTNKRGLWSIEGNTR